jgi:uncharacterized protein YeaO (DUF488 family)
MGVIKISRVYDQEPRSSGKVVLVDRLWPRGVSHDDIEVGDCLKDVAPSTEVRQWFSHDPYKWQDFCKCYVDELNARTTTKPRG